MPGRRGRRISVKVSFPVTGEESDGCGRELGERRVGGTTKVSSPGQHRSIGTSAKNHKRGE
jgi:hypothetical protein